MKIELTDDEVTIVLVALDNYRDQKELAWITDGFLSDQTDAGSAEWVWQKIMGARQVDRIAAEVRANATLTGYQETFDFNTKTNLGTSASVDPFGLHPDAEKK